MEQTESTLSAQVSYSPVERLEVAASVDADFYADEENRTQHIGGGFAIGGYAPTDVLRLEGLFGINGGWARGDGRSTVSCTTSPCATPITFDLAAPYAMPFAQILVGFEVPYFELAGGARLFGVIMDVTANGTDGSSERTLYARAFMEPFVTIRVPLDIVRFEVTGGVPLAFATNTGLFQNAWENLGYAYVTAGIGFQIDTISPSAPEEPMRVIDESID